MCDDLLTGTMSPRDYLVSLVTVAVGGGPNGGAAMRRFVESEGLDPTNNALRMLLLGAEMATAVVTAWAVESGRPRDELWQQLMTRRAMWKARFPGAF